MPDTKPTTVPATLDSILQAVGRLRTDEELATRLIDDDSNSAAELRRIDHALWTIVDRDDDPWQDLDDRDAMGDRYDHDTRSQEGFDPHDQRGDEPPGVGVPVVATQAPPADADEAVTIVIVDEAKCPECGAGDDWNNRPKVGDDKGRWWWKCYRPTCPVSYYLPETGETEH